MSWEGGARPEEVVVKAWKKSKTVVLRFSSEDQVRNGGLGSTLPVKQLSDGAYAILVCHPASAVLTKGSKLSLEIDGESKGWVVPIVNDVPSAVAGSPFFLRLRFKPAE